VSAWSEDEIQQAVAGAGLEEATGIFAKCINEGFFAHPKTLAFHKLQYALSGKLILYDVSGVLQPGSLTAVLGGTENGSQGLLQCMAQAVPRKGVVAGHVDLDGRIPDASFHRSVGYVPVEDLHLAHLTVRETVHFSAKTRLPSRAPEQLRWLLTDLVIKLLGLSGVANSRVGDGEHRGISGGEKRRLSLAVELVSGCSVLILDRPTDGLDASAALGVADLLRALAQAGMTVASTLMQPSDTLLCRFDQLLMLSRGRLVLYCTPRMAEPLLLAEGFVRPDGKALADYVAEVALDPAKFHHPRTAARRVAARHQRGEGTTEGGAGDEVKVEESTMKVASADEGAGAGGAEVEEEEEHKEESARPAASPTRTPATKVISCPTGDFGGALTPGGVSWQVTLAAACAEDVKRFLDPELAVERLGSMKHARSHPDAVAQLLQAQAASKRWLALSRYLMDLVPLPVNAEVHDPSFGTPLVKQIGLLLSREAKSKWRDKTELISAVIRAVGISSVVGSLYWDIGLSQSDTLTRMGELYFLMMVCNMAAMQSVPSLFRSRVVYYHQRMLNYFHGFAYFVSYTVSLMPVILLELVVFSLILYEMSGLQGGGFSSEYWYFTLALLSVTLVSRAVSVVIASVAPSEQVAQGMFPLVLMLNSLYCGFLNARNSIAPAFLWLYYGSFFTYALRGIAINEHESLAFSCSSSEAIATDANNNTICAFQTGNDVLELYDMETDSSSFKWQLLSYQIIMIVAWNALAAFLLVRTDMSLEVPPALRTEQDERARAIAKAEAEAETKGLLTDGTAAGATVARSSIVPIASSSDAEKPPGSAEVHVPTDEPDLEAGERTPVVNRVVSDSVDVTTVRVGRALSAPGLEAMLSFDDLSYFVPVKGGEKQLLFGVHGMVQRGSLLALMGPSGAGKTTLLDVLARRKNIGRVEGNMLINGTQVSQREFQMMTGYVEQFDSHEPNATVREAIEFAAELRLPAATPAEQRVNRVEDVLDILHLRDYEHSRIGKIGMGGLSPEIRKLVSIGVELVSKPSILFLDEPTTGLDSTAALNIAHTMKRLSEDICVVATVHQPSAEVFASFDTMLLLCKGGKMAYLGPTGDVKSYFSERGLGTPRSGENVADFALNVTGAGIGQASAEDNARRLAQVNEAFKSSELSRRSMEEIRLVKAHPQGVGDLGAMARAGFVKQFRMNLQREWRSQLRDREARFGLLGMTVMVVVIMSTLFWQISNDQTSAVSRVGALFLVSMFLIFSSNQIVPVRMSKRLIVYRERASQTYSIESYFFARALAEMPTRFAQVAALSLIAYWTVGFDPEADKFFYFVLVAWFAVMTGVAMADFSTGISPDSVLATLIHMLLLIIFMLAAGFLIVQDAMPTFWRWVYEINPIRYAVFALSQNELDGLSFYCPDNQGAVGLPVGCDLNPSVACQSYYCPITTGEQAMARYSMDSSKAADYLIFLIVCQCVFRISAYVALKFLVWVRR